MTRGDAGVDTGSAGTRRGASMAHYAIFDVTIIADLACSRADLVTVEGI